MMANNAYKIKQTSLWLSSFVNLRVVHRPLLSLIKVNLLYRRKGIRQNKTNSIIIFSYNKVLQSYVITIMVYLFIF